MANISRYLDVIQNGIYGRDVRSAIHDSIDAINRESSGATIEVDQMTVPQIDTIIDAIPNLPDTDPLYRISSSGCVSPTFYGAKGDGVTDDTAAIQRCINENPGGTIIFGAGVYKITSTIHMYDNSGGATIYLNAARLVWDGLSSRDSVMVAIDKPKAEPYTYTRPRLYGGSFDGNKKAGICLINNGYYADIAGGRFMDFRYAAFINGDPYARVDNVMKTPFRDISLHDNEEYTVNGLTFSPDEDNSGRVIVTGTATRTTYFNITGWALDYSLYPVVEIDPEMHYMISGCPEGGSSTTYSLDVRVTPANGTPGTSGGGGTSFSETGDGRSIFGYKYVWVRIKIYSGYNCPRKGLVFQPLLEKGEVVHDGTTAGRQKSLQATIHDMYIHQTDKTGWLWSEQDTRAIVCVAPDSQFSNIVTHRTKWGIELVSGGNSFTNCHTTTDFRDWNTVTETMWSSAAHILLNPPTAGQTQTNVFTNMYFNIGKYVMFSKKQTNMCTTFSSSHYTFYETVRLKFAEPKVILFGGAPSDIRVSNFDVVIGAGVDVFDYFPNAQPFHRGVPDKLEINSNVRHSEAHVLCAYNLQPETYLTPLINSKVPATLDKIYEVGAIAMVYSLAYKRDPEEGENPNNIHRTSTNPIKLTVYTESIYNEYLIGFQDRDDAGSVPVPYVMRMIQYGSVSSIIHVYIARNPSTIDLDGRTYYYYPIYLMKTSYPTLRVMMFMSNNSPFTKCYMRNVISEDRYVETSQGLIELPTTGT